MDWEDMTGNDEIRFCRRCQQNIYKISEKPRIIILNQKEKYQSSQII